MNPSEADSGADRLVVIGASAGGVETLRQVVADLPSTLPACVCVVLHLAPGSPSALASILGRAGPLPCRTAADGEPLAGGQILVAAPDRHLTIEYGRVALSLGPRENGHRPAIDALFRSAARARGARVIGVVLSGTRDDGTAGLAVIKGGGGLAVVQDPAEAIYPGMPASALAHVEADAVVPSDEIGATITRMVNADPPQPPPETDGPPRAGEPVVSVCPECGGVLSEQVEGGLVQWGLPGRPSLLA